MMSVVYLSDDLISEIFTRLPPNSLLRFRSLSKSWYSRISSPGFIRMHTSRSPQKLLIRHRLPGESESECFTLHSENRLPLCPKRGYMDISQVEVPQKNENCYVVGSCNGIICLFHYEDGLTLWNPSIGRQLDVPDCPLTDCELRHWFGFDPITDDYKILCISFLYDEEPDSSFVYTIKTGSWCVISSPIPLFSDVASNTCFVNGALHWVVRHYTELNAIECLYILTFDLNTHDFGTIAMPQSSCTTPAHALGLTTIQGSLGLVSTNDYYDNDYDDILIWVKRDASWSVVLKLKADQVGGSVRGVLQPSNNGDMLLLYESMWPHVDNPCSHVYNPKIGAQLRLAEFNASSYIVRMEMFVESLYLLDMESACESNHLSLPGGKK